MLRKLAWFYTAGFLGIFLICHTPGLTDDSGRLLGLFRIDPILATLALSIGFGPLSRRARR